MITHTMIVYYDGPTTRRTLLDRFMKSPGKAVYRVNPQLYQHGIEDPIDNMGVADFEFDAGSVPDDSQVEGFLKRWLEDAIGAGPRVGERIIPVENIEIKFERYGE